MGAGAQCRMNMSKNKKTKKNPTKTREKVYCKDGWMFLNKHRTLICLETTTNKQNILIWCITDTKKCT